MYKLLHGNNLDVLKTLPANSVQCVVTSPPYYGLRDYGVEGQIGLEQTPNEYIAKLVAVFSEVRRVLKDDGTLWLNLGDSYVGGKGKSGKRGSELQEKRHKSGKSFNRGYQTLGGAKQTRPTDNMIVMRQFNLKPKDLMMIPAELAIALRNDGWYLRSEIVWHKPNPMTESMKDRPTRAHEMIYLLTKNRKYYYDYKALQTDTKGNAHDQHARVSRKRFPTDKVNGIRKPGYYPKANARDVWSMTVKAYKEAHFATYPEELPTRCILAGSKRGDIVLDPFNGSGTTGAVALQHGREYIGIELNHAYIELSHDRISKVQTVLV